jgi:hypothetical protein
VKRPWLLAVAAAAVLAVAFLFWTLRSLDARVARAIERVGTGITGTAVRVGRVDLELSEARGTVWGLRVASPSGFSSHPVLEFGEITLDLDVASLGGEPLVLSEVRLLAPKVRVEVDDAGRSNVAALLDRLGGRSDSGDPPAEGDAATRLRVDRFRFEEGRIEGDASALGGEARTFDLPALQVAQLGGSAGLAAADLGREVLLRYLGHVAVAAAEDAAFRFLEEQAEELGARVGEAAKGFLRVLRGDSGPASETD